MRLQGFCAVVLAGGIGLLASAASAAIINVNLNPTGSKGLNGTAWDASVAPLAYTGTTWTDAGTGATDLLDSTGASTTVDFSLATYQWFADGWGGVRMLQGGFYNNDNSNNNATMTLTLSGLDDSKKYDLYIAAAAGGSLGGSVTMGATNLVSTGSSSIAWAEGTNYVHFASLTPVGGQLSASIAPAGGGVSIVNGFQIAEAVPEPTSLALLGLASLGMLYRRRAV